MSAGRSWIKELYVGFLLLALSFLYLSHLKAEFQNADLQQRVDDLRLDKSELLVPAVAFDGDEDFLNT